MEGQEALFSVVFMRVRSLIASVSDRGFYGGSPPWFVKPSSDSSAHCWAAGEQQPCAIERGGDQSRLPALCS